MPSIPRKQADAARTQGEDGDGCSEAESESTAASYQVIAVTTEMLPELMNSTRVPTCVTVASPALDGT